MQSIKTDLYIIYMVPDYNQKVLQIKYWEGKVDCYGKKGMSLLVFMERRWKVDGEVSGFEYSSVDFLIKGCSGQDHVQVIAVTQVAVDTVQEHHPAAKRSPLNQIMQVVLPHNN